MREKKPTLNHRAGYGARRSRAVPRRSNRSLRGQYRRGCHVLWYVFTDRKKTDLRPTGEEYYHNYNYYFIMFVTGDFHVTTHSGWPRCGRGARRDFHVRACVPVAEVTRATTGPIDDARSSRPRHSRKGGEKQKTKRKKKKKEKNPRARSQKTFTTRPAAELRAMSRRSDFQSIRTKTTVPTQKKYGRGAGGDGEGGGRETKSTYARDLAARTDPPVRAARSTPPWNSGRATLTTHFLCAGRHTIVRPVRVFAPAPSDRGSHDGTIIKI